MQSDDFPTKGNGITGSETRCLCITGKNKSQPREEAGRRDSSMGNWALK